MPAPISPGDNDWISGAESRRIAACSPSALQRAAMLGHVRVKLDPGCTPRYSRRDVEQFAQRKTQSVAKRQAVTA
jgi:hypothetical protein